MNSKCDARFFLGRQPLPGVREAVERALGMEEDGADIIDIGGESSRPGAEYVSAEEETARILPVIAGIRKHSRVAISVDTRKKAVMKAALEAGADMLNDISALEDDPALGPFAAESRIPVMLMHKRGRPATMQLDTAYGDPVAEVRGYLEQRAERAAAYGIARNKIILDPGIGFGKDLAANTALVRSCSALAASGYPILMALSRKTCIGEITGRGAADRMAGTLAACMMSVLYGASILRVHDTAGTADMLAVLSALTVSADRQSDEA